jgi:hypothetical protein
MARSKEKRWALMLKIWRMNALCLTDLDQGDRDRLPGLIKEGKVVEAPEVNPGAGRIYYKLARHEHTKLDRWYGCHAAAHKYHYAN